jgi:hypothetical protein
MSILICWHCSTGKTSTSTPEAGNLGRQVPEKVDLQSQKKKNIKKGLKIYSEDR